MPFLHLFPYGLTYKTQPNAHPNDEAVQACQDGRFTYIVFRQFRQAKFDNNGLILSSSQFLLLPQQPLKIKLASRVVNIDSK